MSRRLTWIALALLIAGALALPILAQGPPANAGNSRHGIMAHAGAGAGQGGSLSHLDLSGKTAFEGVVDGVSMEPGAGTPSFTMLADGKKVTIVTSPYRALLDAGYKISVGDRMNVLAYPFVQLKDTYAAAELKNLTTGVPLTLRDENGVPTMRHGACGNCPLHTATQVPK